MDSENAERCVRGNIRMDSLKKIWRGEMYQGSPEGWIEPILTNTFKNVGFGIEIKMSACRRFSISSRILRMNADGIFDECIYGS